MNTKSLLLWCVALAAHPAFGKIKTATVAYQDGDTALEGFVAYDDANEKPRPGVLVIHDWTGLQEYAETRTKMLAELGYVAFAADIYGKGVRPGTDAECGVQAGKYLKDAPLLRRRATLGYAQLLKQPRVEAKRTAAIGYCFGGSSVLELARSGADLAGVVSFHGGLGTSLPAQAGAVKAKVLVCHGADDPFVKPDQIAAFKKEMAAAKVDLKFIAYPGAVHAFTKPAAGSDKSSGKAYDAKADQESWAEMKAFFAKLFAK